MFKNHFLFPIAVLIFSAFLFSEEIILQNGLNGYSGCEDSYITEDSKDSNFGDENALTLEGKS